MNFVETSLISEQLSEQPIQLPRDTVQDLTLLYELALNLGQSLNLKENCKRFLKVLMTRKNLKYASVWLRMTPTPEPDDCLQLAYGSPKFWHRDTELASDHLLFTIIPEDDDFIIVDSMDQPAQFDALITEKNIQSGVFVLIRLGQLGVVKLYGAKMTHALSEGEILKLMGVMQGFTKSLQACFAHDQAIQENFQRQQTEISLKQVQAQLNEQLAILEKNQVELAQTKQQVERKNQRLLQALKKLKKTQAQLVQTEKMSGLGQMVAGVAHEINNPVNFIYANLSYVQDYVSDLIDLLSAYQKMEAESNPEAKVVQANHLKNKVQEIDLEYILTDLPEILKSMETGADRIQKIVASLRTFSRLDQAEQKSVDIHPGIESSLMILRHRFAEQLGRPEVQVIREYGDLPEIDCYPGQLNQVFMNLLVNAIDAIDNMPWDDPAIASMSPTITVKTQRLDEDQVQICISDNGPGIPLDVQKKLFDPFFTTKPVGRGVGLGLSISYQIVTESHQGRIECLSQVNQGAEFTVTLPVHQAHFLS